MLTVALPGGDTDVSVAWDVPERPWAALALAHGAGAGMEHPFLAGFAEALAADDVAVLRFAFPYREAGRRMPGPAAHAVSTWAAAMDLLTERFPELPRVAAGKSYGGRMASMAAADGVISPAALVYLGYPFHPPGKPDAPRAEHLPRIAAPQLFLAGSADPFIQPIAAFEAAVDTCPDGTILWTPGGGHSFEVKGARRTPELIAADLAASATAWLRARL